MRKTITVGTIELEVEANMASAELYRKMTQRDWDMDLVSISKMNSENREEMALKIIDLTKHMAFVMATQAKFYEEPRKQIAMMNEEDYIIWLSQFGPRDFNQDVYLDILKLWRDQNTTTSEAKN
jgi:hypothetical protein